MVCEVCRHDAPYTRNQLVRRQQELDRNPTIDIYPCPDCGGTDYMLSTVNLDQAPPRQYDGILTNKPPTFKVYTPTPRRSLWSRLTEWWRHLWK
jgi:hypothetical protein